MNTGMRLLGLLVLAGALVATAAAAPPRPATVSAFVGDWWGHTRSLQISRTGQAVEVVDDGCCTRVVSLRFRLLRPSGTVQDATVGFRVTSVGRWDAPGPRPRVGQLGRLRLRDGIVVDPLTGANYCNARTRPARARLCGA
jgi:hypothetical protein